jgi:hypothetical protein
MTSRRIGTREAWGRCARDLGRRAARMPRVRRGAVLACGDAAARAGTPAAPGGFFCVGLAALDRGLLKNFE